MAMARKLAPPSHLWNTSSLIISGILAGDSWYNFHKDNNIV